MRVKSKRYSLLTLILGFALSMVAFFAVSPFGAGVGQVKAESGSLDPIISYSFEDNTVEYDSSNSSKLVKIKNQGSLGASGDAEVVHKGDQTDDITILDGSYLRILQWETFVDNGYVKFPDNMFAGLSQFTITMDVVWARMGEWPMVQMIHCTSLAPESGSVGNILEFSHCSYENGTVWGYVSNPWIVNPSQSRYSRLYNEYDGPDNQWGAFSDIGTWTLTIAWDGANVSFYVENDLYGTAAFSADEVHSLTFNRLGGYLYNWGRSATNGTFDNFNFYNRYFTAEDVRRYNDGLILNYDFSADSVSADGKTVANKGMRSNWNASLEGSIGGSIKDGKLVFERNAYGRSAAIDVNNSYLKLPSDLFRGLNEFTFSMDIDHYDAFQYDNNERFSSINILYCTENDPITANNELGNRFSAYFNPVDYGGEDWRFNLNYDTKPEHGWENYVNYDKYIYNGVRYSDFNDSQFKLTIVYKDHGLTYYWDDVVVLKTTAWSMGLDVLNTIDNIHIGGYVFDWGRSATIGEFDNVKLYNRAMTQQEVAQSVIDRRATTDVIITGGNTNILTTIESGSSFTLPATYSTESAERVLVGYYYKGELYKPGETIIPTNRAVRIKAVLMDFFMQDTAQIRLLTSPDGFRFKAQYGNVNYVEISETPEWDDIQNARVFIDSALGEKGMIFTRTPAYNILGELNFDNYRLGANMLGGKVTNDKLYAITRDGEVVEASSTDAYRFVSAFLITEIDSNTYAMDYYARGYYKVAYKSGQDYVYTNETVNKNIKAIAQQALSSGTQWSESDLAILNKYAGING